MPFYEYKCTKCGHALEALQKLSDPPLRKCPDCGKAALKKLISSPVFRFKGSGWYETDFKSDKEGKRNLADAPEKEHKPDEKKDDKKKEESKPEPTSETKPEAAAVPAASATGGDKPAKASTHARKRAARKPK
ncbi:MAG: FmdB family zinc ribbon protein [Steroidobacterales bacterium]